MQNLDSTPGHDVAHDGALRVNARVSIPRSELSVQFVRSSGPGGQNVNKTSTKVELRFALRESPSLGPADRAWLEKKLASRLTVDGVLTSRSAAGVAKLAIIETLNKIDSDEEAVFLQAIRHVQMEPRWGDPEDSAAHLRGAAAFGLVRMNHPGVVLLLVELLTDPEKIARCAAARALGESRLRTAVPLLRFKARTGDKEPEVIAECLARPALAERLLTDLYDHDQRFHGELKRCAEAELKTHRSVRQMKQTSGQKTT